MIEEARIRSGLVARQLELTQRVRAIEADMQQPLDDDFAEQAIDREDDETLDAVESAALAEIKLIEEALGRLDAGTYGICTQCGDEISPKRLEALPACRSCISCAEAER
jgi:RNA polymerase-binding transcription factor DksA